MTDMVPSSPETSARMSRVRNRDTSAELALRRELHRRGLRYRVNHPVPGLGRSRPDVLFPGAKIAVFVDGCFWHRCPDHATFPKSNECWWLDKLEANVARDRATDSRLLALGWQVLRIWEHEDVCEAADRIESLAKNQPPPGSVRDLR